MKAENKMQAKSALLLALTAMGLAGCTVAPLKFQVVDSDSKLPLAGVYAQKTPINRYWPDFAPTSVEYAPSGPDGMIQTDELRPDFDNFFDFGRDGYIRSQAILDIDGKSADYSIGGTTTLVKISPNFANVITIPMRKLPVVK